MFLGVAPAVLLGACGGGGGAGPAPVGSIAPPAAPAAVQIPAASFDTAEYRRSNAAVAAGAISAWTSGADGAGVVIGFVDSGIDTASPEFAGRISSASRDVTGGGRSVADADGHGTAVVAVAAAARDSGAITGVAPAATIAAMRADTPGSCATDCSFAGTAIAAGIDAAVAAGARIVSLSLGGGADSAMQAAFSRARAAGTVLVVAAGNDAGAVVDPLAQAALSVAGTTTIVVGSVDATGAISGFSNRAGAAAPAYLATLGEAVRSFDNHGTAYLYSGTSIAVPAVAGAAALLAQHFPNLTAAQIVDLLLRTARDAGDPGTDPVYGRGILDIAAAFAPVGGTSIAGTATAISTSTNGTLGAAFGTGLATALGTIGIVDSYGRGYRLALGQTLTVAGPGRLAGTLAGERLRAASVGGSAAGVALALHLRAAAGATASAAPGIGLAGEGLGPHAAVQNPLRETRLSIAAGGLGFTAATGRLAALALPGDGAGGLVAPDAFAGPAGITTVSRQLLALEAPFGRGRLGLAAEHATDDDLAPVPGTAPGRPARRTRLTAALSVPAAGAWWTARVSDEREDGALLGTQLSPALGLLGGRSIEVGGAVAAEAGGVELRIAASRGWHQPLTGTAGLLRAAGPLRSSAWSVAAAAPAGDGRLRLTIARPRAIDAGGFLVGADGTARFVAARATAAEHAAEFAYAWHGLDLALFGRTNPGNVPGPADAGFAIRWESGF
jgi:subtilisin family serine protease